MDSRASWVETMLTWLLIAASLGPRILYVTATDLLPCYNREIYAPTFGPSLERSSQNTASLRAALFRGGIGAETMEVRRERITPLTSLADGSRRS